MACSKDGLRVNRSLQTGQLARARRKPDDQTGTDRRAPRWAVALLRPVRPCDASRRGRLLKTWVEPSGRRNRQQARDRLAADVIDTRIDDVLALDLDNDRG